MFRELSLTVGQKSGLEPRKRPQSRPWTRGRMARSAVGVAVRSGRDMGAICA